MEEKYISAEPRRRGRPPVKKDPEPRATLEPEKEKTRVTQSLTPEEMAIYARVAAESSDWQTITEESVKDFSLSKDPFELPEPAKKLREKKEFAFRWITRSSARLDEMKNKAVPFRWWPVNLNQPVGKVFKPFIDPNNGCVSREDQMLVFKPYWMFEKEIAYKQKLAARHDESSRLESKNGETRKAGRDSDVDIVAGKRSGLESKPLRQEVKGSDIQFRGEEEVDIASGRSFPAASESDLTEE